MKAQPTSQNPLKNGVHKKQSIESKNRRKIHIYTYKFVIHTEGFYSSRDLCNFTFVNSDGRHCRYAVE